MSGTLATRIARRAGEALEGRVSRRGLLVRSAVLGSALVAAPREVVLKPVSSYTAVCGPDATAAAGYTVFCCTVNDGVNECPPGTFAGGWWKADASPYCCSGGRPGPRYYVDCQAECTQCSGTAYRHFCTSSCSSCQCDTGTGSHAADRGGSCDGRKLCCNQFRYGQCHTEIAMSGAVACRVVTCTPPYELFDACSPAGATDDSTRLHTAPCLPGQGC